jgi:pseudaminic acid biosynthesis-associated methylase
MTEQIKEWTGEFGREYTDRNSLSLEAMDGMYFATFGVTRTALNERFLGDMDRDMSILEVGANIGNQLLCLKKMGFTNLHALEVNPYAAAKFRERLPDIPLIQASALSIPFSCAAFDLVYTSGVLIHISPDNIAPAMSEIVRCSSKYVWGFEYYAPQYTTVTYRGHKDLLWKTDFSRLYRTLFPTLGMVREEKISYKADDNVDAMFLLKKR